VTEEPRNRRRSALATGLLALAVAEAATTAVAATASGLAWDRLVDLFVVTNTVIGLSLAVAGWPIARYRPRNPVGWWLLAGGCLYAATATGIAVLAWVVAGGRPAGAGWRVFATVTNGSWPWALALCLPMALLLFPDGRLPGRGWRWVVATTAVGSVLFAASAVFDPLGGMNAEVGVPGYPAWRGASRFGWVAALGGLLLLASYLALPVALATRYRRGSARVRDQLLWPVLAALAMVACFTAAAAVGDDAFILLGVLPLTLVPASIAIAILRHRLLDIRLVVSRSLVYLLLTGAVLAAYLGLVSVLDRTVGSSILAALVIAVGFNPARVWVQVVVDRALYGARRDPVRAIAAVGARLTDAGLDGVLAALCA
jgi:two-component system, NarL family, sensor kinase